MLRQLGEDVEVVMIWGCVSRREVAKPAFPLAACHMPSMVHWYSILTRTCLCTCVLRCSWHVSQYSARFCALASLSTGPDRWNFLMLRITNAR